MPITRQFPIMRKAAGVLLFCGFLVTGLLFFLSRRQEFLRLELPSYTAICVVGFMFIINIFIRSLFNLVVSRKLDVPLTVSESFMLSAVATASNFILPFRAGVGIRAIYLKRVHNFPFGYFASALTVFHLLFVILASAAGLAALCWIYHEKDILNAGIFFLLGALLGLGLILLGLGKYDIPVPAPLRPWLLSFTVGYRRIIRVGEFFPLAMVLVFSIFVSAMVVWVVILWDYRPSVGLAEVALLATSQVVGGMITLTPGGAGFQELAGLYVGKLFLVSTVELFAALIWVRAVRTIVALILGIPSLFLLRAKLQDQPPKTVMEREPS